MIQDPEDEAFNEIEQQAKQRKEAVKTAVHTLTEYQRGYETGFIDGMQKQAQSSVDKAVNAMSQRTWVGLTNEEIELIYGVIIKIRKKDIMPVEQKQFAKTLELLLRKKNT